MTQPELFLLEMILKELGDAKGLNVSCRWVDEWTYEIKVSNLNKDPTRFLGLLMEADTTYYIPVRAKRP